MLHRYRQVYGLHKKKTFTETLLAKDVETGFDILNYELDRPLPKAKRKWLV